jgi:hypothetical protein
MSAAIEAAMLDAHRAGLSVIPLRSNKRPARTSWAEFIDTQPNELLVRGWAHTTQGFAILCGGETRLQVLDFEGRFMEHLDELKRRLGELGPVFESWLAGYFVATPGGGFHVGVHVEGDGTPPGNLKLASDLSGMTLVETRGHGGYVAAAPSNGTTHPSGQPWVQQSGSFGEIAWATADQWQAVCAVISTFDAPAAASETPPEALPPRALPGGVSLSRIEHTSSWIEGTTVPSMEMVLDNNGWTHCGSDPDHSYWARPGKDPREGHSATVNASGRLFVFSSNAHPVPPSPGKTTYDSVDVLGCYLLGHFPSQAERVEVLRSFAGISGQPRTPTHGVSDGWLSDDFWTATPWLEAVRVAAWGNGKCPEGLLGAVLSAYSVRIPSSIRVAPIVHGVASPLNLYVALCGPSGSGKSSTMAMAQQLCDAYDTELYHYGVNLRSGEGLVTEAIIPQQTKRGEPPPEPRFRLGLQVEFDEGKTLAVQNDRSGATMVPYLTTAWSGQRGKHVGGTKSAGSERFPADLVRVSLVLGVQYGVAGSLFTGDVESLGFPGRFLYFGMDNPGPKLVAGEQRRVVPLILPRYHPGDTSRAIGEMTFPLSIQQEILDWDYARSTVGGSAIDGHRMLLRARLTCLLALMDDFAQPELIHWQLAGEIETHSLATRQRVLAGVSEVAVKNARAAGRMDAIRENERHLSWVEDRARALARAVHEAPLTARQVKDRFNKNVRQHAAEVVQFAIERDWVLYRNEGHAKLLVPGESRPS